MRVLVAFLAAFLFVGCASKPSSAGKTNGAQPGSIGKGEVVLGGVAVAPAGYTVYTDPVVGVSLAIPPGYALNDHSRGAKTQFLKEMSRYVAGPMQMIDNSIAGPQLEFFDLSQQALSQKVFAIMGVSVMEFEEGSWNADEFKEQGVDGASFVGLVSSATGPGLHFSTLNEILSISGVATQMQTHLYCFGTGKYAWNIVFNFPTGSLERMKPIMQEVIASARFNSPNAKAAGARKRAVADRDLAEIQRQTAEERARMGVEAQKMLQEQDRQNAEYALEQQRKAAEAAAAAENQPPADDPNSEPTSVDPANPPPPSDPNQSPDQQPGS